MYKTVEPGRPAQANTLQIPIAQAKQIGTVLLELNPSAEGLPALPFIVSERGPPAYLM